jgi:hypothetical protein
MNERSVPGRVKLVDYTVITTMIHDEGGKERKQQRGNVNGHDM